MPFDCIMFDLDGTLVDSKVDLVNSMNHALKELGLPMQESETICSYVGWGLRQLIVKLVPPDDPDMVERAITIFRAHYRDHCLDNSALRTGAKDILEALKGRKLAVVTNKTQGPSEYMLEELGILHHFDYVIGGNSVVKMKPHAEPVLKTLEVLKAKPESSIIIGDSAMDIEAGKAAGISTCAIKDGIGSMDSLMNSGPDHIIDELIELKGILL